MWFECFNSYLLDSSFTLCTFDANDYVKRVQNNFVITGLYIDDSIFVSNTLDFLCTIKWEIIYEEIEYCLGRQIKRDKSSKTITLSQTKYIDDILKRFIRSDCKLVDTPLQW